jgi:hypothetical protein
MSRLRMVRDDDDDDGDDDDDDDWGDIINAGVFLLKNEPASYGG